MRDSVFDTINLYDEKEERNFVFSQGLVTLGNICLLVHYVNPEVGPGCINTSCGMGQIVPTFDCSGGSTVGNCSGGGGGCSGGGGDCSGGSTGGDCSGGGGGGTSADCSGGGSTSSSCASPIPFPSPNKNLKALSLKTSQYSSKEPLPPQIMFCAALSPLACYVFMKITKYPIRKPMAISSITGAMDGLIWSYLIWENYHQYTKDYDPRVTYMFLIFGISAGNLAGSLAGSYGGSEGAYVLKTTSAVYFPYLYFQVKRMILGRMYGDENETKVDLGFSTLLSVGGALSTFALNFNNKDITAYEGLIIGISAFMGALVFDRLFDASTLGNNLSYDQRERIKGFFDISGSLLFAYLVYKELQRKKSKTTL